MSRDPLPPPASPASPTFGLGTPTLDQSEDDLAAGAPARDAPPPPTPDSSPAPRTHVLARGDVVGRYVVLSRLGQGGMSVVYMAYDPELDRKVALKLLLERRDADPVSRTRLLREAQALAKLSHPNVVAVHDVGTLGERVYLAMELVVGQTIAEWLGQASRPFAQLLAVFVAAGEALVAAHAAGVVHRDFKPDNVMLGDDGRVRVMDFGLARAETSLTSEPDLPEATDEARADVLSAPLTRTGSLLGTPRYMAPEQWRGEAIDHRSDQFAFCVSLWEALYGAPPFAGESLRTLSTTVQRGELRVPKGAVAPAWVQRILRRGLSVDPQERWPSMRALLEALARGRARQRIGRGAMGLGLVGLGALGVVGWQRHELEQRIRACEDAGAEIGEVWNDDASASLHDALVGTGVAIAQDVFERTVPWIDRWTSEWSETRTQVCLEVEEDGTRSTDEGLRVRECLADHRDELAGLLAGLGEGDRAAMSSAISAAAGLSSPTACLDPLVLARWPAVPDDSAVRERLAELRRELASAKGLGATGHYRAGLAAAAALLVKAEGLGHDPFTARVRARVGELAFANYELERASKELRRAYVDAGAHGDDELAASAATSLVQLEGSMMAQPAQGLVWAEAATMLIRRLGAMDGLDGFQLRESLAELYLTRGAYDEARIAAEEAVEIAERLLGHEHPGLADALTILGGVLLAQGDAPRAAALHERAVAITEATLGPTHPVLGRQLLNFATMVKHAGDGVRAQALLERALPILEAEHGTESYATAAVLNLLGAILNDRGEHAEALVVLERMLAIMKKARGADHPDVGKALINVSEARARVGDDRGAREALEQAIALLEARHGPEHPLVGTARSNLAKTHTRMGAFEAAAEETERSIAIAEEANGDPVELGMRLVDLAELRADLGQRDREQAAYERARKLFEPVASPERTDRGEAFLGLGAVALAQGRPADAIVALEQALVAPGWETRPHRRATIRLWLAKALADAPSDAGRDLPRARELAREAFVELRDGGPALAELARDAEQWLAAHPP